MSEPARPQHVLFTGGGTGGHLFPALAVAQRLRQIEPSVRITFAGSGRQFEREQVAAAGFDYLALPCAPFRRHPSHWIPFLFRNGMGYWAARRFLRRRATDVVVGTGGYASVPMARAAAWQKIPLVLLEQNVVPGRANRWLARRAAAVCTAFEETGALLGGTAPVYPVGTPIRFGPEVISFKLSRPQASSCKQLLILGGSGGARSLNQKVPHALHRARAQLHGWQILHQTGAADLDPTRKLYDTLGLDARAVPFLDRMDRVLARTDLVVSRSGGSTLAELAVMGVPAVVVPYPHAADDHQRKNALCFTAAGASLTLEQDRTSAGLDCHLAEALSGLLEDDPRRRRMAEAMRRMARPDAARRVAELIGNLVREKKIYFGEHGG